jgi:ornithine lipid hydroxylase
VVADFDSREDRTELAKDVVRRTLVLAVLMVPLVAACWRASGPRSLGGLTFGTYLVVAGLLVACEHWLPFDRRWRSAVQGSRTDFAYVILASLMDKVILLLSVTIVASLGGALGDRLGIAVWPSDWNLGVQVALALVVADVGTYVRHRLFHRSDFLWRFHRIHHSMTELYWIRSAYTHPVEQFFLLGAIMLPIAFLGAGEQVVAIVAFLFGLSGLLQHANVDARSSVLNYVFATPEVHRVHHAADERSRANFSAFFVWMDLLFGTYRRPSRSADPVGVGLAGETAFPTDFLSHLTLPFRRDPLDTDRPGSSGALAVANER